LCATTQVAIINQLLSSGHEVTVLGPDVPTETYAWEHVQLKQSSMKGKKASSLAKSITNYLKDIDLEAHVVFIDWALVRYVSPLVERNGIRWMCIDRSPPADANLFAKLQRNVWKKAWKMVASSLSHNRSCAGGMVVSLAHQNLIKSRFSIAEERLCILHAGVNNELFKPNNFESFGNPIQMVYHGKLDRHRGILKLVLLLDALENNGIEAELTLIGTGDLETHLWELSKSKPNLNFRKPIPHSEIGNILQEHHIGFLPMPNLPVWTISSPLKRSEYMSSGLLVLGINHSGHHLPTMNSNLGCYKLFDQQTFVADSVEQIQEWMKEDNYAKLSAEARQYAETHLDWSATTQSLVDVLESLEE
jgi:glycosyltransferase involved in cell wall biosynthesis